MIAAVPSTRCVCPACGSTDLDNIGTLPSLPNGLFGGQAVDIVLSAGHLMHCKICDLQFRNPCLSQAELTALYEKLPDKVWQSDDVRPYWPLTLRLLDRYAVNDRVLDVGCFCGDLLYWLPGKWKKFGIEPGSAAREVAQKRGIKILGQTMDDLSGRTDRFGAVLVYDVIEHITRPISFLKQVRGALADGGSIILFTGASDTWPFRLFGRRYWYSSLPEHVSFYSLEWFKWAAKHLEMISSAHHYLSSDTRNFWHWSKQFAQLALHAGVETLRDYQISERFLHRLPVVGRATQWKNVPWWNQAKDHIIAVLTDPA